jgi:hypothetical protein
MKSSTKYSPLLLNWCIYFVKGGKYHVLGWLNQNYKDSATEFLESEFIVTLKFIFATQKSGASCHH